MDIREQLKESYNALLDGQKKRAAIIHGCESNYFGAVASGNREVKDDTIIQQMIQSVKQASKDILEDAQLSYDKING